MFEKIQNYFEIKFTSANMEIITANNSFYSYLGEGLYVTAEQLFSDGDRAIILFYFHEKRYEECFLVQLIDKEGKPWHMIACISAHPDPDVIYLRMIEINFVFHSNKELVLKENEYLSLLGNNDDTYFIYHAEDKTMELLQINGQRHVLEKVNLREWYEKANPYIIESEKENFGRFVSDLESGTGSFQYLFSKFPMSEEDNVEIVGSAIHDHGNYYESVGRISSLHENMRQSMMRDQLTGLALKDDITTYAQHRINHLKKPTTIAVIDIDDFKNVNDSFGHKKGDEVLKKCAQIINDAVKVYGRAGRIGGDEFFIVFDALSFEECRSLLRTIKNNILCVSDSEHEGIQVTTSIGCASYPKDVDNFDDLFLLADYMLYRAKDKGKNRFITYEKEKHGSVEEVLQQGIENIGVDSRGGMTKSEIICKNMDKVIQNPNYPVANILNDIVDYLGVERVILYEEESGDLVRQCGTNLLKKKVLEESKGYFHHTALTNLYEKEALVINNIQKVKNNNYELFECLAKQGILSLMQHTFTGKSGKKYVISYESVSIRITWNKEDMHYFRILDRILAECL